MAKEVKIFSQSDFQWKKMMRKARGASSKLLGQGLLYQVVLQNSREE